MRENPRFRPYDLNQEMLLPERLNDWLPPDHLARFLPEAVAQLDLRGLAWQPKSRYP